jgi:sugar lactone lactonase YvrE
MCLDTAGNLYIGVADALLIVDPAGNKLAQIALPTTKGVTNCAFGGAHGRVLYITTWTSLYQVTDMPVPGLDWTKQQALDCP